MATVLTTDQSSSNNVSLETKANCFGTLFFTWMNPLFSIATQKSKANDALSQDDLLPLPESDQASFLSEKFNAAWTHWEETLRTKYSLSPNEMMPKNVRNAVLRKTLFTVLGKRVTVAAGIVKGFNSTLQFLWPALLGGILQILEGKAPFGIASLSPSVNSWSGFLLVGLLAFFMGSKAITENMYFHIVIRGGWQLRSAVSTAVYHKSLRLSAAARQSKTIGEIVNLMQIDASKIEMFVQQLHVIWDGAFQISGYIALLVLYIGPSAFVGLAVMLLALPVQAKIMKRLFKLNRDMVVLLLSPSLAIFSLTRNQCLIVRTFLGVFYGQACESDQ